MNEGEPIVRLAAKGDGVTQSGQHVAGAVPGDRVSQGDAVVRGPHHVDPPCRHFARCGACQLQHVDEDSLRVFVRDRVLNAARSQEIVPDDVLDTHISPPRSRRRATLHGLRTTNKARSGAVLGFRQSGAHRIVDVHECHVLHPRLFDIVAPTRAFIARHGAGGAIDVALTSSDQGVDLGIGNMTLAGLAAIEDAADFARTHNLARLTLGQGYGAEPVWEPEPVTVTLSGTSVPLPSGAFLQATRDAERRMVDDARRWLEGAKTIVDLFAGLGTFAFALAQDPSHRILAVEADRAAHLACQAAAQTIAAQAGGTVRALHRDLFRNPLRADELSPFDAVVLDPPRAGARAQIEQIAASGLRMVVYISCNPASWSRDAATLTQAGFKLSAIRPIGQFRWSTQVELASLFERP